uniref:DUF2807 domain-containing protein n=1 Tax=Panagrellus redivivus TaxID=6233 RepID=A0A7E4WC52_PANRE
MSRQFWFWSTTFIAIFTACHAAITYCKILASDDATKITLKLNGGNYLLTVTERDNAFDLWGDDENTVLRVRMDEDHVQVVRDYPVELITTSVKEMNVLIKRIHTDGCQIVLHGINTTGEIINFGIHFINYKECRFYNFKPEYEGQYPCNK